MIKDRKYLSANMLKYIAIIAMTIDHIAWAFIPKNTVTGQLMHVIGRLTLPIMSFFIAEGYYKTKNIKKYIIRLSIFAVISAFAYSFLHTGKLFKYGGLGVIYTLLLGLLAIIVWKSNIKKPLKIVFIILLCLLSMPGDWQIFGVLYCVFFAEYHDSFKDQCIAFSIASAFMIAGCIGMNLYYHMSPFNEIFQLGVFLALPILYLYNGKKGSNKSFNKWIFYIYYPLHLVILGVIKILIK